MTTLAPQRDRLHVDQHAVAADVSELPHDQQSARRFCFFTITWVVAMLTVIAAANYVVNPKAQYAPSIFTPLVQPSRQEKLELLSKFTSPPRGLILGSSRVLKFEPDYFEQLTGTEFFNAGVNYGKIEDFVAFTAHYHAKYGVFPEAIIVGLDVYAFADNEPFDARLLNTPELSCEIQNATTTADYLPIYRDLLGWGQSKLTIKSILKSVLSMVKDSSPKGNESFRSDGLIVYQEREREMNAGTYDFENALAYNKNEYTHLYADYDALSPRRTKLFEEWLTRLRTNGTKVVVFLTPLHPELASHLSPTTYGQRKQEVIAFVRAQVTAAGFTFMDFSKLARFDGDARQFVDGIHPLEANTRRMTDRIAAKVAGN